MKAPTQTLALLALTVSCSSTRHLDPLPGALGFDGVTVGWRAGSTAGRGPMASWLQRPDVDAISPPNVLALSSVNHDSPQRGNLYWREAAGFQDGILTVAVRADDGTTALGGGLLWRARDEDNYYVGYVDVTRGVVAVDVVQDGRRRELAHRAVDVRARTWHRVEIEQRGERIECWLDGVHVLHLRDRTHMLPGGVGLWTFADARSSFDDCLVSTQLMKSPESR